MRRGERVLTKRVADGLKARGCTSDRDVPGFTVRVLKSGTKVFQFRYAPRGGGIRRTISLGIYGEITFEKAKKKAREYREIVKLGGDPVADQERIPTWGAWTVKFFNRSTAKSKGSFHRYFLGLSDPTNQKTNAETDPTFREIRARWSARAVDSFRTEDIESERQKLRTTKKGSATLNRWLACVAACFQAAVDAELIERNPASKVKPDRENAPRSRTLTFEEMGRLLAALEEERDRHAAVAVLLAVLTGARRGEILALRWEHLNVEEGYARLPDSKSGRPRFLPLPAQAVEALKVLDHLGDYVVASFRGEEIGPDGEPLPERPRPDLKGAWGRLSKAAGLEEATFHDLRRTFGRELNRAAGLRVAQEALGHTTPDQTAAAYTPEGFDDVKRATEARAAILPFPKRQAAG